MRDEMNSDALVHRRKVAEFNKVLRRNHHITKRTKNRIEEVKGEIENLKKMTKSEANTFKE